MILLLTEPEAYTDFDGEISPSARAKGSFCTHKKTEQKMLRLSSKCIFFIFLTNPTHLPLRSSSINSACFSTYQSFDESIHLTVLTVSAIITSAITHVIICNAGKLTLPIISIDTGAISLISATVNVPNAIPPIRQTRPFILPGQPV